MPDETTEASGIKDLKGLPDRQVMLINSEQEARRLGAQVLGGYIAQTAPEPKGDTPELVGRPGDEDAALNYAYAIQWWLFAAAVPVGWVVLVRRERRDRLATQAAGSAAMAAAGPADGGGTGGSAERPSAGDADTPAAPAGATSVPDRPLHALPPDGGQDRAMDLGLKDRVYVVTGATRGLGQRRRARAASPTARRWSSPAGTRRRSPTAAAELGPDAVGRRRRQRRPGGRRRGSSPRRGSASAASTAS